MYIEKFFIVIKLEFELILKVRKFVRDVMVMDMLLVVMVNDICLWVLVGVLLVFLRGVLVSFDRRMKMLFNLIFENIGKL